MKPSRLIALFFALASLAIGAFFILRSDSPRESRGALTLGGAEDTGPEAAVTPASLSGTVAATEEALTTAGSESVRQAVVATSTLDAGPTSDFEVVVEFPEGSPLDPELSVVAVSREEIDGDNTREFLTRLRAEAEEGGEATPISRAPVGVDGRAVLQLPEDRTDLRLLLDGRFLYIDDFQTLKNGAETLTLEPRLGGALTVQFEALPGESPTGRLSLMGGNFGGGRGGGWLRLRRDVDGMDKLEFRALDASYTYMVSPNLEERHAPMEMGVEIEPGRESELVMPIQLGATVKGRVVDEAKLPLANVSVSVNGGGMRWMGNQGAKSTRTDSDGNFVLAGVQPGEISIEAEPKGRLDAESETLTLENGSTLEGVELVSEAGDALTGIITWKNGEPVAGVEVEAETIRQGRGWGGFGGGRRNTVGSATTDEKGQFAMGGLEAGTVTVKAVHTSLPRTLSDEPEADLAEQVEFVYRAQAEAIPTDRKGLELTLEGPIVFAGRVLDDLDQPVTQFSIEARSQVDGGPRERQSFENEEGKFSFARVGPGEWNLRVRSEGFFQEDEVPLTLPGGESNELVLRLSRRSSIAGRVLDGLGQPVAGARVVAADSGGRGGNPWGGDRGESTETDEEGNFKLGNLEAAALTVSASAPNWADSEDLAVELAPGEDRTELVLQLRRGGTIMGTVFGPDGEPQGGRRVTWGSNAMGFGNEAEETSDASGTFTFNNVTPGRWTVSASPSMAEMGKRMQGKSGESAWAEVMGELVTETVEVEDEQVVEVFLGGEPKQPVRIFGTVMRSGEPLDGAQVYAVSENSAVFQGMKTAQVEADGSYELVIDRPGPYVISARQNRLGVEQVVTVPKTEEMRVDLNIPRGMIRGTIELPDGKPAVGVRLALQRDDGLGRMRWGGDQATTDAEGKYDFDSLEPGRYTVRANISTWGGRSDSDFGSTVRSGVDVGEDETVYGIDFELQKAGVLEGVVEGPGGTKAGDVALFFRDASGLAVSNVSSTRSDSAGRFKKEGLAPGTYTVSARGDDLAASDEVSFRIVSGETTEVTVPVQPGVTMVVTVEDENGQTNRTRVQVLDENGRDVGGLLTTQDLRAAFNEGSESLRRELGPFPPGKYKVIATLADGRSRDRTVRLRDRDDKKSVKLRVD